MKEDEGGGGMVMWNTRERLELYRTCKFLSESLRRGENILTKDEETVNWRKFHSESFHTLYSSPSILG